MDGDGARREATIYRLLYLLTTAFSCFYTAKCSGEEKDTIY